jgi:hypothetical protein
LSRAVVTIDSNVVLDCFERQVDDACALIGLHPDSIRIQVANRTPDRETRSWASTLGDLDVSRQTNFARFDVSVFDGPDVLAGDDDVARLDALEAVVFPGGRGEDLGKASDIDILDAHLRSKAEYFVTRDRHLLHPRDELRRMFGIVVLTPAETLAELDRQD